MANVANTASAALRQTWTGLRLLVIFTIVLGIVYPAGIWLAGRLMADRADGQPIMEGSQVVGSTIIGQSFPVADDDLFHSRPSATDYDPMASAPSNLGPSSPDLMDQIQDLRDVIAQIEGVDPDQVPADAFTASASGLDPYISPEYAALQIQRVADHRGLTTAQVEQLVAENTQGRQFGFLGEPRVNVVQLNQALEEHTE